MFMSSSGGSHWADPVLQISRVQVEIDELKAEKAKLEAEAEEYKRQPFHGGWLLMQKSLTAVRDQLASLRQQETLWLQRLRPPPSMDIGVAMVPCTRAAGLVSTVAGAVGPEAAAGGELGVPDHQANEQRQHIAAAVQPRDAALAEEPEPNTAAACKPRPPLATALQLRPTLASTVQPWPPLASSIQARVPLASTIQPGPTIAKPALAMPPLASSPQLGPPLAAAVQAEPAFASAVQPGPPLAAAVRTESAFASALQPQPPPATAAQPEPLPVTAGPVCGGPAAVVEDAERHESRPKPAPSKSKARRRSSSSSSAGATKHSPEAAVAAVQPAGAATSSIPPAEAAATADADAAMHPAEAEANSAGVPPATAVGPAVAVQSGEAYAPAPPPWAVMRDGLMFPADVDVDKIMHEACKESLGMAYNTAVPECVEFGKYFLQSLSENFMADRLA